MYIVIIKSWNLRLSFVWSLKLLKLSVLLLLLDWSCTRFIIIIIVIIINIYVIYIASVFGHLSKPAIDYKF